MSQAANRRTPQARTGKNVFMTDLAKRLSAALPVFYKPILGLITLLIIGIATTAAFAQESGSATAGAQCTNWDFRRPVFITEQYPITLKLEQNGRVLSGTATTSILLTPSIFQKSEWHNLTGRVEGTIDDSFSVQIFWEKSTTPRVYTGKIQPSGRIQDEAYNKKDPNQRPKWSILLRKCPPPPPPTPPYIIAGKPVIPTPSHPFGIVVLAWDGGPDNSDAEVLMSIDNGAVIPAFSMEQPAQSPVWKQAKMASIPLQLQRGHYYKFILKNAAGKTLSTAAFVVPQ
jgi:hypothetical protein